MADRSVEHLARLYVHIESSGLDDDEMDELTRHLWSELRDQTDAERVELLAAGPAPDGSKGVDAVQLGDLAVHVLPVALPALIAALRSWSDRQRRSDMRVSVRAGDRAVELEYPVGTMTRDDLMRLVAVATAAPGTARPLARKRGGRHAV
jgi:Effector Associated Constant Component 1